jgi:orotate phosphoribosyltransferase
MNARSELLRYLATFAYQFDPVNRFLLVSGKYSDEYLDCKLALSQPGALVALGAAFLEVLKPDVVAVGGLTMGADPIAMSTSYASSGSKNPVRWFTVRKEPKSHGQKKLIEGSVAKGDCVAVVDDVVTSGKSTIQAINDCRDFGLRIAQVVVLVDRQESDGMDNIRKVAGPDVDVVPILTKQEIKARWAELDPNRKNFRATA